jgi:hypothetical protein
VAESLTITSPLRVILTGISSAVVSMLLAIFKLYLELRAQYADTNARVEQVATPHADPPETMGTGPRSNLVARMKDSAQNHQQIAGDSWCPPQNSNLRRPA